ncbi:MAG: hypothetical protein LQ340_001398 [Diploschistes diacapsis]|nr:MAG: hypothetical protein LQ340_001398 [Diploschistes diacapsis]
MIDFQSLKALLFTLAPFAIPYAISSFRKYQSYSRKSAHTLRPVPRRTGCALNILFVASIAFIIASFYAFSYENLITDTGSRILTPSNVLWERVAAGRPDRALTELDEKLKARLASTDGKCLYVMYGPETVGNCPFCSSDDPRSFFYYAVPEIFLPHLLNFVILGLVTSDTVAGKEGNRFRTLGTVIGCVLALLEITAWYQYDWKANARVTRASDMFQFYGWARLVRSLGFAVVDMGFAAFLWATATNRLMVVPPNAVDRVDQALRQMEMSGGKIAAAGIVKNAVITNEELRRRTEEFFKFDSERWTEVMADEEVERSIRQAQSEGRLDMGKIKAEAEKYVDNLIPAANADMHRTVP